MPGFPDWQRITEWIGPPLATATGFAIGGGSHTDGPISASSWASVVLAVKPTGGTITATVRQIVAGGPASLIVDTVIACPSGVVTIESVPLLAGNVELILQGSAGGETVDYALSPANTTTRSLAIGAGGVISGLVAANGTITAGSGFTVNRTGVGVYVVTFSAAFAAEPVVLADTNFSGGIVVLHGFTAKSAAGFTLATQDRLANPVDAAWNFTADLPS